MYSKETIRPQNAKQYVETTKKYSSILAQNLFKLTIPSRRSGDDDDDDNLLW